MAKTEGLDGVDELKRLGDFTPEQVAERSGVDVGRCCRLLHGSWPVPENAAIMLGLWTALQGVNKELAIAAANLALLAGIPGREGSGLYLCGEKANSQGAIDLGILPQG